MSDSLLHAYLNYFLSCLVGGYTARASESFSESAADHNE